MDTCPRCGSPLIEIYKACRRVSAPAKMCTVCHTLWFNGERTELPGDWDKKYPNVAKRANEVSDVIVSEALKDPNFRARGTLNAFSCGRFPRVSQGLMQFSGTTSVRDG